MIDQPPSRDGDSDDLLLDIVETLETCGLGRDEYQLQEYVDVDALENLVSHSGGDVEVRVTVEGVSLSVSKDGVYVLNVR
jgi:hypothetical protein